jgi:hypothetical protein
VKLLEWIGIYAWLLGKGLKKFRQSDFGDYCPTDNDVIVCSGLKSGTNWTMQIAVQIAHRGDAQFGHIHDLVPWPELPKRAKFAIDVNDNAPRDGSPTGLRVIKTHLPMHSVPYTPEARYICVVRDPKDVLVSAYFFFGALAGPLMPSLRTWLKISTSPDALEGGWADHLNSYWQMRNRDNVLFLTFEQMKEDLPGVVNRIAKLMGVALTPEEHATVVEKSRFEYMKQEGHKFDPIGLGFPGGKARGAMVRRGERGKSDELLTVADRNRIDDFWRSALVRIGSDFPYDDSFPANR